MNFFQKFRDFAASPSHSRTMGILMIFVLAAAVSVTVIAGQQRQTTKQRASELPEDPGLSASSCIKDDMSLPICDRDQGEGANCNPTTSKCRAINDQGQWDIRICQKQ